MLTKLNRSSDISLTEGTAILKEVGSRVSMHCNNNSISTLNQLTWTMNGHNLISFKPKTPLHFFDEGVRLNINMSRSESRLYAVVIESAQTSHTGNYTCMTNTETGALEQKWELIITGALLSPNV